MTIDPTTKRGILILEALLFVGALAIGPPWLAAIVALGAGLAYYADWQARRARPEDARNSKSTGE